MSQLEVNLATTIHRERAQEASWEAERRRIVAERNRIAEPGPYRSRSWWEGIVDVFRSIQLPGQRSALSGT